MVSRHPLWPLFLLIVFSTACQQRYAYIPKVKANVSTQASEPKKGKVKIQEDRDLLVESSAIEHTTEAVECTKIDSFPSLAKQEEETAIHPTDSSIRNSATDSLNKPAEPIRIKKKPIPYSEISFGDKVVIFCLQSISLILALALIGAFLGICYYVITWAGIQLGWAGFTTLISISSLFLLGALTQLAEWLIKTYLGNTVNTDVIYYTYLIIIVLLLILGIVNLYLGSAVLLGMILTGLLGLFFGSGYARKKAKKEESQDEEED